MKNKRRFVSIINYFPLEYKELYPLEKKLTKKTNPPKFKVKFFEDQKNLGDITCYSNDGGNWKKTNINFEKNFMFIKLDEKFVPRRGRVNCSLNQDGWRWLCLQFSIKTN